jgi:hypothetical protein
MKSTSHITYKVKDKPEISLGTSRKENLPLPYVQYPGHYGTFIMFSEGYNNQLFFCECCKDAVYNFLQLIKFEDMSNTRISVTAPLSSQYFPYEVSMKSLEQELDELLVFKKKLCHRCNLTTPSVRYCHEMYGGNFKQYYGWYINQTKLKLGILNNNYIVGYTPMNFIELLEQYKNGVKYVQGLNLLNVPFEYNKFREITAIWSKNTKIKNNCDKLIENITRQDFGFKKVGEAYISESILTNIVRNIFPYEEILIHHRPQWLNGLELDIYLPNKMLAFEYQGQQHFFSIKAWGGEKSYEKLQERDRLKKELCKHLNIKLLEIDYTEPLNEDYIINKLNLKGFL